MLPSQRNNSDVLNIPSTLPLVIDDDVDLGAEGDWYWPYILPTGEIYIRLSLWGPPMLSLMSARAPAWISDNGCWCFQVGTMWLELRCKATRIIGNYKQFVWCCWIVRGAYTVASASNNVAPLGVTGYPIENLQARGVSQGKKRQLSASQAVFSELESERDQSRALAYTELRRCNNFKAIFIEARGRPDDHSSLPRFSHKMLPCSLVCPLQDFLRTLSAAVPIVRQRSAVCRRVKLKCMAKRWAKMHTP